MKVAIIGYGKMGRAITQILQDSGDDVIMTIDRGNVHELAQISSELVDVAIEFSTPDTAYDNIIACLKAGVPVVSGTTAWLDKMDEVADICKAQNGAFFYAPNFSIGVNLFFTLCEKFAALMAPYDTYKVEIEEIHHTQKIDVPSGTAIATAEAMLPSLKDKKKWALADESSNTDIPIIAKREPDVPGTHTVRFMNDIDELELKHTAFSREGFATGAIAAARWVIGRTGIFGMKDMLDLENL